MVINLFHLHNKSDMTTAEKRIEQFIFEYRENGEWKKAAAGTTVGYFAGSFVGGLAGLVSSPFTGGWAAAKTVGTQKNVETWGFTNHLKDLR